LACDFPAAHILAMENTFTRRRALGLGLAGLTAPYVVGSSARAAQSSVLVELFTSQGCSDCPPADKLAGELKARPGIHVVSLNVDYWDYLGWHDTLGKAQYSQRQQEYARVRGDNDVYTPQMVINGEAHAVGSNRMTVEAAIAAAQASARYILVSVSAAGGMIEVSVGEAAGENGTLWLMGIAPDVNVAIGRGENAGANITYHNVVRNLVSAGSWDGSAKTFSMAHDAVIGGDCRNCVAVLQKGHVGKVLGLGSASL
jgi:hypothetical protein